MHWDQRLPKRYRVRRVLGKGGMGEVLLAYDSDLERLVAIKILLPKWAGAAEILTRFRREARIQGSLNHPHVVQLYECELEGDFLYLVMEYIEGETLEDRIRRGPPFTVPELGRLAKELAGGVQALHELGVFHRDLKPANLMVRAIDQSVVVMDLGLVLPQNETNLTKEGVLVGTPYYMPPDVLRGKPWSAQADQYQVAAIVFEAATGQNHFEPSVDSMDTVRTIMDGQWNFDLFRKLPEQIRRPLLRGLSADSSQRFETLLDLEESLNGSKSIPESLPYFSAPPIGLDPLRVSRWVLPLAFVVGFVLCFWLWPRPTPPPVWHVGSDVLEAFLGNPIPADLGIQIEGEPVPIETYPTPNGAVLRWEMPSAVAPVRARLSSSEGLGPVFDVNVLGSPLRPDILLSGPGRVQVHVLRSCVFWWKSDPQVRWVLEPGERQISLPIRSKPIACVKETGPTRELPLAWETIAAHSVTRLRRDLAAYPLEEMARKDPSQEVRQAVERGRKRWLPLLPWMPRLLTEWLPLNQRRELLLLFQDWQRSEYQERLASGVPTELNVPWGQAGFRMRRSHPRYLRMAPASTGKVLSLRPLGAETGPSSTSVKMHRQGLTVDRTNPPGAQFRWPDTAPQEGLVAVNWRGSCLWDGVRFQMKSLDDSESPVLEGFGIRPNPRSNPNQSVKSSKELLQVTSSSAIDNKGRSQDFLMVLPADLLPKPGSLVGITLLPLGSEYTPDARVGPLSIGRIERAP